MAYQSHLNYYIEEMKKLLMTAGIALAIPAAIMAQSAVDAYSISQGDLRGTARFMSMGGAFTALGGDISTLNQNPGGIGVYRYSDLSVTLDINRQSTKMDAQGLTNSVTHTNVACNNFGYVGSVNLGSESAMPFFNWGASYSRVASFDRRYSGSLGSIGTSLTNLVADYTMRDNTVDGQLAIGDKFNPYQESYDGLPYAPWMSILMYNAGGINPVGESGYSGLWDYDRSQGTAAVEVEEKGHVDEFSLNFGGNIENVVFWGIGFGITDIEYKQNTYYTEEISDAVVPGNEWEGTAVGSAGYGLGNWKRIWGNGFNMKVGLIFKPINEFRLGIAVHTPTWYNLSYQGIANMGFDYSSPAHTTPDVSYEGNIYTDEGYLDEFDWKFRTPWRLMAGVAGVLGGRAIISADYEYRPMQSMEVQDWDGNKYNDINDDIKTYYRGVNILRLGAEYRLTPAFSLRAGYSYESSPVTTEIMEDYDRGNPSYVYTSGPDDTETQPSFTLDKSTQYFTLGLGYKYKNFYADAAYVHRTRQSRFQAFTNYEDIEGFSVTAPSAKLTDNDNSFVLTVGLRF